MIIEKNKIVTIKLVTGEEIIAKIFDHNENKIIVQKPLVIMMSPQGLAFATFVPTMDHSNNVEIDKNNIIVIGPTNDKVAKEYSNATSPIKTPPKSSLIV
jgi:hypothetical protein